MPTTHATETRLRRALARAGYALRKSRRRPSPDNLGEFMVIDTATNGVVLGDRYDATLAEVAAWLDG